MKKLWFGLFAFVLSVCCGFAIVHGSYTRANLIAHSNAVNVSYDILPSNYDNLNWRQTSDFHIPSYNQYTRPIYYNGSFYQFDSTFVDAGDVVVTITNASTGVQTTSTYSFLDPNGAEYGTIRTYSAMSYIANDVIYFVSARGYIFSNALNVFTIDDIDFAMIFWNGGEFSSDVICYGDDYWFSTSGDSSYLKIDSNGLHEFSVSYEFEFGDYSFSFYDAFAFVVVGDYVYTTYNLEIEEPEYHQ